MSDRKIRGEWIVVWLIAIVCLLALGWYAGNATALKSIVSQMGMYSGDEVKGFERFVGKLISQRGGASADADIKEVEAFVEKMAEQKRKQPPVAVPKVRVKPVGQEVVNPPRKFIGHVEAQESVEVKARVAGYLTEVAFLEGDVVKEGDLLFSIDDEDYKARVTLRRADIAKAEAAVERAANVLKRLEAVDARSVSQLDLDNARADVSATKAVLAEAEAGLQLAEIDLKHTKVYAPITGKIGKRHVSKGDYIVPAGALVRIVQLDPVRVVFSVTDRDFVEFKTRAEMRGDSEKIRARIILPTGDEYAHPGIWDFYDNSIASTTPTLAVWMMAENKEGVLLPNTYVTVLVEGTALAAVPAVDLAAVSRSAQGAYVYTVGASNTVEMTRVKLGQATDRIVAVESGLGIGDRVIVEGIQSVRVGMAVEVLE